LRCIIICCENTEYVGYFKIGLHKPLPLARFSIRPVLVHHFLQMLPFSNQVNQGSETALGIEADTGSELNARARMSAKPGRRQRPTYIMKLHRYAEPELKPL
jgi:hypothetical protein